MANFSSKAKLHDREFKELVDQLYEQEFSEENKFTNIIKNVKLVPSFIYDMENYKLKILFKEDDEINSSKDLNEFYNNIQHKQKLQNGDIAFTIYGDSGLYKLILQKYTDIIYFVNKINVNKYYTKKYFHEKILVRLTALEEIINYVVLKELRIDLNDEETKLFSNNININYEIVNQDEYCEIILKKELKDFNRIIYSKDAVYIIYKNIIYRCNKNFMKFELKLLEAFLKNNISEIRFKKEDLTVLFSLIMPEISEKIKITDSSLYEYKPEKLKIKLYLDFNEKKYIVANVKFSYNNNEFNPLIEEPKNIKRNILKESMFLNKLRKTGFLYDSKNKNFVIADNDVIYKFITTEIEDYNECATIYGTDNFNNKKIRTNKKISIGVKVDNGLLNINFNELNFDKEELKEILQKYKLKKKYHRLKDGTFINLENNNEVEFIDNLLTGMNITYKEVENYIRLPINRALYLDRLLSSNKNVEINTDNNYNNLVNKITDTENDKQVPEELNNVLRDYQKIGFNWLKNLDEYNFGGILADDMGLGKTIQVLSVILDYVETNKERRTSIVVSPSSLLLNWYNEAKKFAKKLNVLVINGDALERKRKLMIYQIMI